MERVTRSTGERVGGERVGETSGVLSAAGAATAPRSRVGGKAWNLALMGRLGLPVPDYFVVAAEVFESRVALHKVAERLHAGDRAGAAAQLRRAHAPRGLSRAVRAALAELGDGPYVVRSSAVGEDAAGRSFAGQFDSVVNVIDADGVLDALRVCWASAFSDRVATYCAHHGLDIGDIRMAVVVQRMVTGDVSGVLFTADPAATDPAAPDSDDALVSAAWGLGEGVVSGRSDTDEFRVNRAGDVTVESAEKRHMVAPGADGRGTQVVPVPEERRTTPCLTNGQVRALVAYGRRLEQHLGAPQDVEWTFAPDVAGGQPILLQTRPLSGAWARTGRRWTWDNSNIIESYSGVTSPLTYTFARGAYEVVYRQFCEVMGVPRDVIARNSAIFRSMIGYIQGRVFYRLDSWYQVLAMLPGFEQNKRFMEQMMGVREKADLGEKESGGASAGGSTGRRDVSAITTALRGAPYAGLLALRSLNALAGLGRRVEEFHAEFDSAWEDWGTTDFATLPPEDIVAAYRDLERRLLWNWKAPIINDFYAMIFFGVLRKLVERYDLDDTGMLHNDLLCGEGGLASTEPARRIVAMARAVGADADVRAVVERLDDPALLTALGWGEAEAQEPALASLRKQLLDYLAVFGDRCMDELKLEEPTLNDDPTFVLAMLRNYLAREDITPAAMEAQEKAVRAAAEAVVNRKLRGGRKRLFGWVLGRARRHIRDRENMRLVRTRVFGLVRRLFRGLGDHMARRGVLNDPQDVFWLTVDEVFGWVNGTGASSELAATAALRAAEGARWRTSPPPDDRFETRGPVGWGNAFRAPVARTVPTGDVLTGIGCAPGIVRGEARIIHAPTDDLRLDGQILVAHRTDPGWVPIYPSVSGILVERGSALSHSAIVAREFGIPTVVGIEGLLERVTDGQELELDGAAGTVNLAP